MSVVYERTGGFVGMQQRLQLDPEKRTLSFRDRRLGGGERALTDEERQGLEARVARARAEAPPSGRGDAADISDSFTLRLYLDGEDGPAVSLHTVAVPLGRGEGSGWGELFSFLDRLLETELQAHRPKGAPQILSAEDLEK